MNPYPYGYAEPVVPPPRRKRSLSSTRTDPSFHDDGFGFGTNRMRRNFSTDHIPNDYLYGNGPRPLGNGPMGSYMPAYQQMQHQHQQPLSPQFAAQHHRQNAYSSSGNLYSPASAAVGQHQQPPPGLRMSTPMAFQMANSKVPIRAHQDYLKYAQGANVPYNPYSSGFNPTLMARPTIEPFQSTAIQPSIANAIARGRDPTLYSSKEHLQMNMAGSNDYRRDMHLGGGGYLGGRSPPERPPPPRYNGGLSTENLADFELDMNSRLRDRRSVSPSRFSPSEQRPYSVRRSTSPLPSAMTSALNGRSIGGELPLSRSGSRTSLNQGYSGGGLRMSRESSPLRSPSPYSSPSSPYFSATNHTTAFDYKPLTGSASTSAKYTSRSSILGNREPSNRTAGSSFASGHAISSQGNSNSISHIANSNANTGSSNLLGSSSAALYSHRDRFSGGEDANTKTVSNSVGDEGGGGGLFMKPAMDTLQVPTGHDDGSNRITGGGQTNMVAMSPTRPMDRQFSESFTDHCDQYKSLTSKILAKKANRLSGDFSDVNLPPPPSPLETAAENTIRKSSYSPSYSPDTREYDDYEAMNSEHFEAIDAMTAAAAGGGGEMYQDENGYDLHDTLLPAGGRSTSPSRNDVLEMRGQSPLRNNMPAESNNNNNSQLMMKQLTAAAAGAVGTPAMRRSSSSNGLSGQQRKGSLPSDYISKNANSIALSSEWSREKVAAMSAEARQRQQNPPNSTSASFKKIGHWFTRQFVFLIIAGLNILLAYVFYNLLSMLPVDEVLRK